MSVSDGGPAFPFDHVVDHNEDGSEIRQRRAGMSLRDYFAAAALPAVMAARAAFIVQDSPGGPAEDMNQESIAEECYELADALIAEREQAR